MSYTYNTEYLVFRCTKFWNKTNRLLLYNDYNITI